MARAVVGIDLGTSNTVVAEARSVDGQVDVLAVEQRVGRTEIAEKPLFPSCAFATVENEIDPTLFGEDTGFVLGVYAKRRGVEAPNRFIGSAKSWLSHPSIDKLAAILPWGEDDVPRLSPFDASARVLGHVRAAWEKTHGGARLADQHVILTVPASFNEVARELTVGAATKAGLAVRLLEEPQAAFYAAMERGALEAVTDGGHALVVDVGGGTTDLSLFEVSPPASNGRRVKRVAVGSHLLLGGDNMDLALAHAVEARLSPSAKLEPRLFAELTVACRDAKERLLGEEREEELPIAIARRGAALLGATLRTSISREETETIVLDGFFPRVERGARPSAKRSGLVGFGLPYERDAGITRHVAAFLSRHVPENASRLYVLLNGGVFRAPRIRARLLETLSTIAGAEVVELPHADPDLAVARGAALFGLALLGRGQRIEGGSARAYFIGLGRGADDREAAVCVLPKGAEESLRIRTRGRAFHLLVGREVRFDLLSSDDAITAAAGDVVTVSPSFERLPPLTTKLEDASAREIAVDVETELTAVGTLEISCVERGDAARRFRLAFDLRTAAPSTAPPLSVPPGSVPPRSIPARSARAPQAALSSIDRVFGKSKEGADPKEAKGLLRELEKTLGERSTWSIDLARSLADALLEVQKGRRRSAEHERVYFLLTGYCLRPGFGAPGDRERVGRLVPLFHERLLFSKEARGWQQFFVAYRRVAGGLEEPTQLRFRAELDPFVAPAEAELKKPKGARVDSTSDLLELLSHLERVPAAKRAELGGWLLERTWTDRDPRIWAAIGRLGARVPAYASVHHVVSVSTAERWLDHLLRDKWADLPTAPRAAADIARMTHDRARDVTEAVRAEVAKRLAKEGTDPRLVRLVTELVAVDESDRASAFGESLPPGLRIADVVDVGSPA